MHAPSLSVLEQTPELLDHLLRSVSQEALAWQPSPDRWSISMVLAHLADVETGGFRSRFEAIGNETDPFLASYDPGALFQTGSTFDASVELATFRLRRLETLQLLRSATQDPHVLEKTGRHQDFGTISYGQLLNEFAFHDLGHVRQIMELFRAHSFYPHIGAFQSIYKINP